jgi:hypothetical protein
MACQKRVKYKMSNLNQKQLIGVTLCLDNVTRPILVKSL